MGRHGSSDLGFYFNTQLHLHVINGAASIGTACKEIFPVPFSSATSNTNSFTIPHAVSAEPSSARPAVAAIIAVKSIKRSPKRLKYSSQRLYKEVELFYVEMDPMALDTWKLEPVVELIKDGAVGVIPTDTVYAIVYDLRSYSSIEWLQRIKGVGNSKPLSILYHSLQDIDTYTTGFARELPKQCIRSGLSTKCALRKHVGVQMPDDIICQTKLNSLEAPLISTSVRCPAANQWMIDPVMIS